MARTPDEGVERSEMVYIRFTSDEKVILKMASEKLDMSLSDFIRFNCLPVAQAIYKGVPPEQVLSTASGTADYFAMRYQASSHSPVMPISSSGELKAPAEQKPYSPFQEDEVERQLQEIAKQVTDELSERLVEITPYEGKDESEEG